jgi:hypothetical protein
MTRDLELPTTDPYLAFKRVKHQIAKFSSLDIISECVRHLHSDKRAEIEEFRHYPPWLLLLLIKWAIRFGGLCPWPPRNLTQHEFNHLVGLMHDFDGAVGVRSLRPDTASLILRSMAFEQFWLQQGFSGEGFAREFSFFAHLDKGHPFRSTFLKHTGVNIEDFIELSIGLMPKFFVEKTPMVNETWFSNIEHTYGTGTVQHFFRAICKDYGTTKKWLDELEGKRHNLAFELYGQSPLAECPLLKVRDSYICYSPVLLFDRLQYYVYRTLKNDDPSYFMDKFGPIFTEYVGKGVRYLGLPYADEKMLRGCLGADKKLVDFLVADGDTNILIEAKGVELPYLGKVSQDSDIIRDKLGTSIIKGIEQGYSVIRALQESTLNHPIIRPRSKNYLLIVTYEEMHLGNGKNIKETIDENLERYTDDLMPLGHIYPVSINVFDMLVQGIKSGKPGLSEVLRAATEADSKAETRKLYFEQHVTSLYTVTAFPSYIMNEADELVERLRTKLSDK